MIQYSMNVCPYLMDRISRIKVKRPSVGNYSIGEIEQHLEKGWSLFAEYMQTPSCFACKLCLPYRVLVNDFKPSRSFRKVLKKNINTRVEIHSLHFNEEAYNLYLKYSSWRDDTKNWGKELSISGYRTHFTKGPKHLKQLHFYEGDKLIAISYFLVTRKSTYAMQCHYDPDYAHLNLGTFSILKQIEFTQERNLPHFYVGFYVENSRSLEYKSRFFPSEVYKEGSWEKFK